jgi:hypothetical protein
MPRNARPTRRDLSEGKLNVLLGVTVTLISPADHLFRDLDSQRIEFMKEHRTGFVWLYLRK